MLWAMEINRNQYFLIGIVVLLLGLQFKSVESYVLNAKSSQFLAERFSSTATADGTLASVGPAPLRTLRPPIWLGYALISVGAVLVLHSLAMKKPGG